MLAGSKAWHSPLAAIIAGLIWCPTAAASPAEGANAADPTASACKTFTGAMDFAAMHYEDFAYATAGTGNSVDYSNPSVTNSNVVGRTALREAAKAALDASRTPGLPDEVSDPMRAWSIHAAKLVLVMGLRGGGDTLNSTATDLNDDAHDVQMACATVASS